MALDEAQSYAATCDAPLQLTLAGPGSGKTTTLVGRFIHLVSSGVDPRRILAVTFTRKAADEMRERVWKAAGANLTSADPTLRAWDLQIATFHSFALAELRRDSEGLGASGLKPGFEVLAEKRKQRRIFAEQGMWWRETGDILDIISQAKERLLNAASFGREIRNDPDRCGEKAWIEAIRYFDVYEAALSEMGAIDFSDFVPRLVATMDRSRSAREAVTGRFDYLLVDEYQDVNPGQSLLLDRFVEDGVRLWAVGDDDQTLFSFRSSDVRIILEFESHYRAAFKTWKLSNAYDRPVVGDPVVVHRLDRNYRSHSPIVEAGQRLIQKNQARLAKPLSPARPDIVADDPVNRVAVFGYHTPEQEAVQVAKGVRALLDRGVPPDEVAVLYRLSALSHHLAVAMVALDVPFTIRGGGDLWQSAPARLLRGGILFAFEGETSRVKAIMGDSARGKSLRAAISETAIEDFRREAENESEPVPEGTRLCDGLFLPKPVTLNFSATHRVVADLVQDLFPKARGGSRGDPDDAAAFEAASAFVKTFGSIDAMEKGVRDLSSALEDKPKDVVVLSTIHKAKGLEWDHCYIVGWEDGAMPHIKATRAPERSSVAAQAAAMNLPIVSLVPKRPVDPTVSLAEEEERRIAYVGITRARLGLVLTYSAYRNGEKTVHSPYLRDITLGQRFGFSLAATHDPRQSQVKDPEILVAKPAAGEAPVPLTRSMILEERGETKRAAA